MEIRGLSFWFVIMLMTCFNYYSASINASKETRQNFYKSYVNFHPDWNRLMKESRTTTTMSTTTIRGTTFRPLHDWRLQWFGKYFGRPSDAQLGSDLRPDCCQNRRQTLRIYGGKEAKVGNFPYHVGLTYFADYFLMLNYRIPPKVLKILFSMPNYHLRLRWI